MSWEPRQAKEFARQLRKEIGDGWRYMTYETRCAFAAQKVLTIVRMQIRDVRVEDVDVLLGMVERALELDEQE